MGRLREEGNNLWQLVVSNPRMAIGYATHSDTTVAADYRHNDFGCKREVAKDLSNEGGGANDIKGRDTEKPTKHD